MSVAVIFLERPRLIALAAVGVLLAVFLVLEVRRRATVRSFVTADALAIIAPRRPGWRRSVTFVGLLAVLSGVILAWARPAEAYSVPKQFRTVIVTIDVSGSMEAGDIQPTRLVAAQRAADKFVRDAPDGVWIGLVTFSSAASVRVLPTLHHDRVTAAIDRLRLEGGTAIGEAIASSLAAVAVREGISIDSKLGVFPKLPNAAIVLLSDGATNTGRSNDDAVKIAVATGVPVSTIALGTANGQMRDSTPVPVDAEALQAIADSTSGHYYRAIHADDLSGAYENLGSRVIFDRRYRDVTGRFVAAALILAALVVLCSLAWFLRIP